MRRTLRLRPASSLLSALRSQSIWPSRRASPSRDQAITGPLDSGSWAIGKSLLSCLAASPLLFLDSPSPCGAGRFRPRLLLHRAAMHLLSTSTHDAFLLSVFVAAASTH